MVFLAAIHDELLRDPDDELAAYYPTVGGRRAPDAGLGPALTRFCGARAERLMDTLAERRTQTNETARCAGLLPGLRGGGGRAAARADRDRGERGAELAAGTTTPMTTQARPRAMSIRRCGSRASSRRGRAAARPAARGVARGHRPLAARPGVTRPTSAGCARACGPTSTRATSGCQAALAVAREHGPVDIRRGDALAMLPGVIESAPAGALLACSTPRRSRTSARPGGRAGRAARARWSATSSGSAASRPGSSSAMSARRGRRSTSRSRPGGRARSRRWPGWATTAAGSSGSTGACDRSGGGRRRARSGRR